MNYNVSSPYNIIVNVYGLTRTIICAKLCQQTMKDIGVIFDDNLLFDSHIAIATTVKDAVQAHSHFTYNVLL